MPKRRGLNRRVSLVDLHERAKGICHLCGEYVPIRLATRDHVLARHEMTHGWDSPSNLALAHRSCNHKRGGMTVDEFKALWAARVYANGNWYWPYEAAKALHREVEARYRPVSA